MRRVCCWGEKELGETIPFDVRDATGGICAPCVRVMMNQIRQETGWTYHVVLSRACAGLCPTVSTLLQGVPFVKVLVDRRQWFSDHTVARPPSSGPGVRIPEIVPHYHVVIRRDCSHLFEDLAPAFAGRRDIQVLVDRRGRTRIPSRPRLAPQAEKRRTDPPVWIV